MDSHSIEKIRDLCEDKQHENLEDNLGQLEDLRWYTKKLLEEYEDLKYRMEGLEK